MIFEVREERVDLLLFNDQLLIKLGGLRETKTADEIKCRFVLVGIRVGRSFERDSNPGQRRRWPGNFGRQRSSLFRLARDVGSIAAALPACPILVYQLYYAFMGDVS